MNKTQWGIRHRRTRVVTGSADRLDAENSVRLNSNLEVVTREISPWVTPPPRAAEQRASAARVQPPDEDECGDYPAPCNHDPACERRD